MTIIYHSFEIALVNNRRDSRQPTGPSALAGTAIEAAAQACVPGRTVLLGGAIPTYNASFSSFHTYRSTKDHDTWGGVAYWDRTRHLSIMFGDRTAGSAPVTNVSAFGTYNASAHQWQHLPLPDEIIGTPHVYCRNAYDDSRGYFYRAPRPDRIHRFSILRNEWEHIPVTAEVAAMPSQNPITWHEGLDALIMLDNSAGSMRLWTWSEGDTGWTQGAVIGVSSYHGLMMYNRTRGDALLISGISGRPCRLISATGTVTTMPPCDFSEYSVAASHIAYDPVSGNYLYLNGRKLWELNPEAGEWRLQLDWALAPQSADWPGAYYGRAFSVINQLGVLLWQTYYGAFIYKPATVF